MRALVTLSRSVTLRSAIASEERELVRGQIVEAHVEDCAGTKRAHYFVDLQTLKRFPKGYIHYPLVGVQIPPDAVHSVSEHKDLARGPMVFTERR